MLAEKIREIYEEFNTYDFYDAFPDDETAIQGINEALEEYPETIVYDLRDILTRAEGEYIPMIENLINQVERKVTA